MSTNPQLLKLARCGPSDVQKELVIVGEVCDEWNIQHGDALGIFLKHQSWKTDAVPDLSDRPQGVLNKQIIDESDLVIAVFWSRFGTPTGEADSGTEEEILRAIDQKKRVLLYFSDLEPLPAGTHRSQLAKVEAFRVRMASRGIYWTFQGRSQFRESFRTHLAKAVHEISAAIKPKKPRTTKARPAINQTGSGVQIIGNHNNPQITVNHLPPKTNSKRGYAPNSIGADANLSNYIEYLCGLYVDYMSLTKQDEGQLWGRIGRDIKTKFRLRKRNRNDISQDRFYDVVRFLTEEKIPKTPIGKKHVRNGTKLCRTYDEFLNGEM